MFFNCKYKDQFCKLIFYVVDFNCECILGLNACEKLNLIKQVYSLNGPGNGTRPTEKPNRSSTNDNVPVNIVSQFSDLFNGTVGCVPHIFKIVMKENCVPVESALQKVSFALLNKRKKTLVKMQSLKIIEKVTQPTDPTVIVSMKNGDIRISLDPKSLNDNMCLSHYQLPTIERVSS